MKKLTLLFCLLSFWAHAQTISIAYTLENETDVDSFYLVETVTKSVQGSARPQTIVTPILFRDTTTFMSFSQGATNEATTAQDRAASLQTEANFLTARAAALTSLVDTLRSGTGAAAGLRSLGFPSMPGATPTPAAPYDAAPFKSSIDTGGKKKKKSKKK